MINVIVKKIYHKLPLRLRFICLNLYYSVRINHIYNSPDNFPVNFIENLDYPIFGNSEQEGYFYRYYQEKEVNQNISPEGLFKYKYEIIRGTYIENRELKLACREDAIYPISLENQKDVLKITIDNNETKVLNNLPIKRFQYLTAEGGSKYKLESKKGFVIGNPIYLKQKIKHKKKLVLCIFVDGLADASEIGLCSEDTLMPNTSEFFKSGTKFHNHFSNAEWTLPSVPGFFTGNRQQKHGFFGPKKNHVIGGDGKILSEIFQENEYLTFQACGNWRKSPAYGYVKGFDRTVYKKELDANEVIHSFLEHMRAFNDRDNFVWLTFMDVHHLLKVIPDVSNQIVDNICVTPWYDPDNKAKSAFLERDDNLADIYVNEIKRLDYYLKIIYDYIEQKYQSDEVLVTLVSDHGQAYLTNDQHPLSTARTKVPWMIRGEGIPQQDSHEFTENVDIFKTLIEYSELDTHEIHSDSKIPHALGGLSERKYVISQSIYPGQTYKAIIRDECCEYRFESKQVVLPNGIIQGDLNLKEVNDIGISKKLQLRNDERTYKNIVLEKIVEWNNRSGRNS